MAGSKSEAPPGSTLPSTSRFLQQAQINPQSTFYKVNNAAVSQLHRFLWTSILCNVSSAHFLPREIVPSMDHALVYLERCEWKLCEAQKRAAAELNERRRGRPAGISSSTSSFSSSSSSSTNATTSSQSSRSIKGKFVPPRQANPAVGAVNADEMGPEYGEERRGMPCGHVFRKGEAIYRCRDCALDDTCVLCAPCFNASNHEGHDIVFSVSHSSGGCCDCGDEEAWTRRICCSYHDDGSEEPRENGEEDWEMGTDPPASTTDFADRDMFPAKGKEREEGVPDLMLQHIDQIESLLGNVPTDVQESIKSSVATMVTYVLDTMEHAPKEMKLPEGPQVIERIKEQPSLEPEEEDMDEDGLEEGGEDDGSDRLSKHARIYSVVLWNDEKHSFREVIDTVSGATEKTEYSAKGIAERVDGHGRDIIEVSGEVKKMYLLAHKLSQIDLAVTVRPAYDVFAEEVAGHVLDFLLDLTNASLFIAPSTATATGARNVSSTHPLDLLVPNAGAMRAVMGRALLEPWFHRKPISRGQMSLEYFDSRQLVHLDGLLLMDNRMWKAARVACRSIYMALLGPREVKRALAFRFAQMYSKLVEIFIIQDREPEYSIRIVTVQLFSVPSIASELVAELDLLYLMTQILHSIFTGQLTLQSLTLPPSEPLKMRASPTSLFLRHQRCYHIFHDMRYLLGAQGVQGQIVRQPRHLDYILDFLSLFNAITPDRRAVTQHIEFESEVWIQIFHVATYLARTAKSCGEAYSRASPAQLDRALNLAMAKTLKCCSALHQNDPAAHSALVFHNVVFANETHRIIDFAVETGSVSFHHPMHWLLAEMLKHLNNIDQAYLDAKALSTLGDIISKDVGETGLMVIFEYPLRVVVKLAQIRSGMWVRNGLSIRSQAHHYRDNIMRDLMYDQDFYLLQTSLAFVPASRMLVSMIARFSLLDWLQGEEGELEGAQYLCLAEEFLLLLCHLLSETSMATRWSMERQVRREIIHFLALGQGTYSDLTKHIGEKLKEHSSFDRILASVSSFRAPEYTTDVGMFELKDEFFDEVEPYFFHYTRNQREKAEQILKERQKKKNPGRGADSFVVVPVQRLQKGQGIMIDQLHRVFKSPVLLHFLFSCLSNVQNRLQETPDNLIDGILHLIMMGLVEGQGDFVADILSVSQANVSLFAFLLSLRHDTNKFASFHAKINWIVLRAAQFSEECRERVAEEDRNQAKGVAQAPTQDQGESNKEERRTAAKARQAAIMQKFSAQQSSFLEALQREEEEEEADEMDSSREEERDESEGVMDDETYARREASLRPLGTCIFCQENLDHRKGFGSLAHVQSSRVMRTTPRHDAFSLQQSLHTPLTLDRGDANGKRVRGDCEEAGSTNSSSSSARRWDGFPSEDHRFGFNTSTCGHLMHLSCFEDYTRNVEHRHAQQIARNHPEDLSRSEFVCPLCKSLGNIILPVPKTHILTSRFKPFKRDQTAISDWIRKINIDILKTSTMTPGSHLQEGEHGTGSFLPWYAEEAQLLTDATVDSSVDAKQAVHPATKRMLERLTRVLKPLANKSRVMRHAYQNRTILAPPGRKMYIPEEVIAYTIAMLEISQRGCSPVRRDEDVSALGEQTPEHVADGVSIPTRELIQSLVLCLGHIARLDDGDYQSMMRHGLLMRLLPHWGGHDAVRSPLLLRDPLTVLVEASAIAPENLHQITILMFYIQLIQVIFGLAQPSIWPQNSHAHLSRSASSPLAGWRAGDGGSEGLGRSSLEALESCFDDVRATVGNVIGLVGYARGNITLGVDNLDDTSLAKIICTYCLPFLRRATILQKSMGVLKEGKTGQRTGEDLEMKSEGDDGVEEQSEFVRLMTLLEIPLPKTALPSQSTRQTAIAGLVEGWIKHAYPQLASIFRPLPIQPSPLSTSTLKAYGTTSHHNTQHHHPTLQLEHPHIYELIRLPSDLTKLLMQCQVLRCRRCGNLPPEPAICLECGELLCFQSFCCQGQLDGKGECNRHLESCGHSSGMFFKVKSNIITLLFQGNGCFAYSPYLDTHGEVDIGLKKGKIQFLHMVRFDELRKQWLNHGIANSITRKIEAVMDQGGWGTM